MTREHPTTMSPDAEALQGRPAGLVSRVLASIIDVAVVGCLAAAAYLATAALLFAWNPRAFTFPNWPTWLVLAVTGSLAVGYLTVGWWIGGRTYGCVLIGLRVVSTSKDTLPLTRSFLRAVICSLFPLGLAWCAVDADGRAVHDRVVHSLVIYDWRQRRR